LRDEGGRFRVSRLEMPTTGGGIGGERKSEIAPGSLDFLRALKRNHPEEGEGEKKGGELVRRPGGGAARHSGECRRLRGNESLDLLRREKKNAGEAVAEGREGKGPHVGVQRKHFRGGGTSPRLRKRARVGPKGGDKSLLPRRRGRRGSSSSQSSGEKKMLINREGGGGREGSASPVLPGGGGGEKGTVLSTCTVFESRDHGGGRAPAEEKRTCICIL